MQSLFRHSWRARLHLTLLCVTHDRIFVLVIIIVPEALLLVAALLHA